MFVVSIIVNIAIIASNGGFENPTKGIDIPRNQDLWFAGMNIKDGDELLYDLTLRNDTNNNFDNYSIQMDFKNNQNYWDIKFDLSKENESRIIYANLSKSNLILKEKTIQNERYFNIIESSLLQIKDITRQPKYLVVGAKWDSINTGITEIPIKIVSLENIKTNIGNLETFVLNYNIGNKKSNLWISKSLPLPVQAEIYNVDGMLQYKYKLINTNIKVN
ncbi:MAG TPA: hypothetical protein VJ697_01790 [Nitrososphaeraceae archaeon]|nr:hypothetical protein [Nitrososphaeraceae archaeon]